MKPFIFSLALLSMSVTSAAFAQESPPVPTEASGNQTSPVMDAKSYCDYVSGIAKSESAILVLPELFGSVGVVSGSDATGGSSTLPPHGRVTAGLSYSLASFVRGNAIDSEAAAECKRYRAESDIRAFIAGTLSGRSATALEAKLLVLETALPRAEATLKMFELGVAEAHNTVDDLNVVQMRTDAIRALIHHTRAELHALDGSIDPPQEPLSNLLRKRDEAEQEVSRHAASVRSTKGWDLIVRGGYEQILDVPVTTPVFGQATLSVDLGWFFQGSPERSSTEARKLWVRRQIEGVDQRAAIALQRLIALRASERVRLVETRALLADLDLRQKTVETMTTDRAKAFAQVVWFDHLNAEAESAYLTAHIKELDHVLGNEGEVR